MSTAECFEDLMIWQDARQWVKQGCERILDAELARFLNIEKGSAHLRPAYGNDLRRLTLRPWTDL